MIALAVGERPIRLVLHYDAANQAFQDAAWVMGTEIGKAEQRGPQLSHKSLSEANLARFAWMTLEEATLKNSDSLPDKQGVLWC